MQSIVGERKRQGWLCLLVVRRQFWGQNACIVRYIEILHQLGWLTMISGLHVQSAYSLPMKKKKIYIYIYIYSL